MKKLVLILALASSATFAETYSECILENMKNAGGNAAAILIKNACEEEVLPYIPKKCFSYGEHIMFKGEDVILNPENDPNVLSCKKKCLDASYWSKNFGDCKAP